MRGNPREVDVNESPHPTRDREGIIADTRATESDQIGLVEDNQLPTAGEFNVNELKPIKEMRDFKS